MNRLERRVQRLEPQTSPPTSRRRCELIAECSYESQAEMEAHVAELVAQGVFVIRLVSPEHGTA